MVMAAHVFSRKNSAMKKNFGGIYHRLYTIGIGNLFRIHLSEHSMLNDVFKKQDPNVR